MKKIKNRRGPIPSSVIPFLIKFPVRTRELLTEMAKFHHVAQTKIIVDLVEKERNKYKRSY